MHCSTCGARVPPGRQSCDTCGTRFLPGIGGGPLARNGALTYPAAAERARAVAIGVCPRCGYRGEGVGYFSRGVHLTGLILATMFTSWAMGAGGLVFYMMRRHDRICPRCNARWGRFGELAAARAAAAVEAPPAEVATSTGTPREGGWALLLFLIAAVLAIGGIVGGNPAAFAFAALAAGGGVLMHQAAQSERARRRTALLSALQLPVLRLASACGGRLTVTQVAAELGWTMPRAEKVLRSLDDGFRVTSEVTDQGLIVYEFRELLPPPSADRDPIY